MTLELWSSTKYLGTFNNIHDWSWENWIFPCSYKVWIHVYLLHPLFHLWSGRGPFPNTWKLGASCHDGEGFGANTPAYGASSWVRVTRLFFLQCVSVSLCGWSSYVVYLCMISRRAEKYFRRGARLDWPDGATSRESMKAVCKLPRLPVIIQNLQLHIVYINLPLYIRNLFLWFPLLDRLIYLHIPCYMPGSG